MAYRWNLDPKPCLKNLDSPFRDQHDGSRGAVHGEMGH